VGSAGLRGEEAPGGGEREFVLKYGVQSIAMILGMQLIEENGAAKIFYQPRSGHDPRK
jgi:hypothetical protein